MVEAKKTTESKADTKADESKVDAKAADAKVKTDEPEVIPPAGQDPDSLMREKKHADAREANK